MNAGEDAGLVRMRVELLSYRKYVDEQRVLLSGGSEPARVRASEAPDLLLVHRDVA